MLGALGLSYRCYVACNIFQHDQFGGRSVMVCGGISVEGQSHGTLTALRFWDENLEPIVRQYACAVGRGFLLVNNNIQPCVERICRQLLKDEGIDTTDWPPHLPRTWILECLELDQQDP